jgi:diguanylate cyclase (GGDEF)-like protein
LHRKLGFGLWMVTRTVGDDWIVLQTEDHHYGVEPGTVFRWADSFCSRMVEGKGPRIAPRSNEVAEYVNAPIGRQVEIKSYVGLPLVLADGSLFGTLCAIDPSPQPDTILEERELIELFGALLCTVLQMELRAGEEARRAERLQTEALTDAMTQLFNRRGWDRLLESEDDRCRRYGHQAAVLIVDLNGLKRINDTQGHAAGDALIARAGEALRCAARASDVVARLGGDEFGILSVECEPKYADILLDRIRAALANEGISASVGFAMRIPTSGLKGAWESADQRMYEEKHAR